jgi:hypothetical protein
LPAQIAPLHIGAYFYAIPLPELHYYVTFSRSIIITYNNKEIDRHQYRYFLKKTGTAYRATRTPKIAAKIGRDNETKIDTSKYVGIKRQSNIVRYFILKLIIFFSILAPTLWTKN